LLTGLVAHVLRGPGDVLGLVFVGLAALAGVSAFFLFEPTGGGAPRRGPGKVATGVAAVFVLMAYAAPLVVRGVWAAARPSSAASLEIAAPRAGTVLHGDPAVVRVELRLVGGRIVRSSSGPPVGNEGHVHVYLDGDLLRLPVGLRGMISVSPGVHEIVAEFVATDHGLFQPRVIASARFAVER
jgi:hypothetical protein